MFNIWVATSEYYRAFGLDVVHDTESKKKIPFKTIFKKENHGLSEDLQRLLATEPKSIHKLALNKWITLRAWNTNDLVKTNTMVFDPRLEVSTMKWYRVSYHGQVSTDKLCHGIGRLITFKGGIYEGQFKNGKISGYGRFIYWNGSYYQGKFVDGFYQGPGYQSLNFDPQRISKIDPSYRTQI